MNFNSAFRASLTAIAVVLSVHVLPAVAAAGSLNNGDSAIRTDPRPFGIELGKTSCNHLRVNGFAEVTDGGLTLHSDNPASLYPGAVDVQVLCARRTADVVIVVIDKRGMGNAIAREAYRTLATRYRRIAGAPIPEMGDGSAYFQAGGTVISQDSPQKEPSFTVSYMTRTFYDYWKNGRSGDANKGVRRRNVAF